MGGTAGFRLLKEPTAQQRRTVDSLSGAIGRGERDLLLEGATGTGKTLTIAALLQQTDRNALIITPNRTLAAQTAAELQRSCEGVAVETYMSYFDHYQPEAYIPQADRYIEKDASRNSEIERMRQKTLETLASERRSIVVATVSCIYGAGEPGRWRSQQLRLERDGRAGQRQLLEQLLAIGYRRDDQRQQPGTFRVRGDTISIISGGGREMRIHLLGDEIETLQEREEEGALKSRDSLTVPPAGMWQTSEAEARNRLVEAIRSELDEREQQLLEEGKQIEAGRLRARVETDLEDIETGGTCPGIENYSRHVEGRAAGTPPTTLLDHLHPDTILVLDESHLTIPQIGGMSAGDRSRKQTLIEYGFRLPSAADNRPLTWEEFRRHPHTTVHMSATPGRWERRNCSSHVEQYLRPTGILDPEIQVRGQEGQLDDLAAELRRRSAAGQAALVIALTRRSADLIRDRLNEQDLRAESLHGAVRQQDRQQILRRLKEGRLDAIVGINLLREGLDLPQVSLVAILDAGVQGFLRSSEALIQACGRAARHPDGLVIMYSDHVSDSMREAIESSGRRRDIQRQHNSAEGVVPSALEASDGGEDPLKGLAADELEQLAKSTETRMLQAAEQGSYEEAAEARDLLADLEEERRRRSGGGEREAGDGPEEKE